MLFRSHEGLNVAAVMQCPMILIVENNQWAFSTPTHRNTRVQSFIEKAPGYGIHGESVDGTDLLAVVEASRAAAERARSGGGVQMIEMRYFRRLGHAQHDPQDYVDPALIAEWEQRDPVDLFHARVLAEDWASDEELTAIREEVFERCRAAAEVAIGEPLPDAAQALEDVYAGVHARAPWTRAPNPDPALA